MVPRGSQVPSKQAVAWAESQTKKHIFAPHTTYPQQDMKPNGSGITILSNIDGRAQPWPPVVRANIHDMTITAVPHKEARSKEVREWIYMILTQRKFADWADKYPYAVTATLIRLRINGRKLREMVKPEHWNVCPKSFIDVDGDTFNIDEKVRKEVQDALSGTILPLLNPKKFANKDSKDVEGKPKRSFVSLLLTTHVLEVEF
jgi:hypothetical protein